MNYEYKRNENPEERLRNKLEPLFHLVRAVKNKEPNTENLVNICESNIVDITKILDDINPFYRS